MQPGISPDVLCLHLYLAESEEEIKSLLMRVKEESEKAGLKLNTQNSNIMAFSTITSWQIDGETMATVIGFIFLGSKITADGEIIHSHAEMTSAMKLKDPCFLEEKL